MSRFTGRDVAISAAFLVGGGATAVLALANLTGWSVAVLGILVSLIGVLVRIQFVGRRERIQRLAAVARATRGGVKRVDDATHGLTADLSRIRREVTELRSQVASMNSDVASTRASVEGAIESNALVRAGAPLSAAIPVEATDAPRKSVGIVGFFGHGNYGDELFTRTRRVTARNPKAS